MKATRNVLVRLYTPKVSDEYPIEAKAEMRGEWAVHHRLSYTAPQMSVGINGAKSQIYGYSAEWGKGWTVTHAPTGFALFPKADHSYHEACALASCLADRVPAIGGSFGAAPSNESLQTVFRVIQDLKLTPKGA